jgi:hypothetical protein
MANSWYDYRDFKITTNKTYKDTRDRLAKGSVKALIVGYYFYVWQRSEDREGFRRVRELPVVDYLTEVEAIAKAQDAIDAIINGLE